jgi:hypothetical protein
MTPTRESVDLSQGHGATGIIGDHWAFEYAVRGSVVLEG